MLNSKKFPMRTIVLPMICILMCARCNAPGTSAALEEINSITYSNGLTISLLNVVFEQGVINNVDDLSGKTHRLKPGRVFVSLHLLFENGGKKDVVVDLSGFFLTNFPNKYLSNPPDMPNYLHDPQYHLIFLTSDIDHGNYEFDPLKKRPVKINAGAQREIRLDGGGAEPDLDQYRLLCFLGDLPPQFLDFTASWERRKLWDFRISEVSRSHKAVATSEIRKHAPDVLSVKGMIINRTPISWHLGSRECIRAFQEDGRELIQLDKVIDDTTQIDKTFRLAPYDSLGIEYMWVGSFEGQTTPVLYFVPPVNLAVDLQTGERITGDFFKRKVLHKWGQWRDN